MPSDTLKSTFLLLRCMEVEVNWKKRTLAMPPVIAVSTNMALNWGKTISRQYVVLYSE